MGGLYNNEEQQKQSDFLHLFHHIHIPTEAIKPTIEAYTKAFNFVCQIDWNDSDSNGVSLQC